MEMGSTTRVFVVDPHPVVQEGLRALLSAEADLRLVGEAASLRDAPERLAETGADVVLVDVLAADAQRLRGLEALRRAAPAARVLVLADGRDAAEQRQALLAGAEGVVSKGEPPGTLLKAIRTVHAGDVWFERRLLASVLQEALETVQRLDPNRARIAALTPRERDVASLVAEGLRNDEIARRLSLSEKTVRNHVVDVCRKLAVRGRLELIVYANRHGLGRLAPGARPG